MKEHFVIDPLISKRQQLLLATQLCRMVLKVCKSRLLHVSIHYVHHPFVLVLLDKLPLLHPCSIEPSPSGKRGSDVMLARTLHATSATNALCVVNMSRTDCHMLSIVPHLQYYAPVDHFIFLRPSPK